MDFLQEDGVQYAGILQVIRRQTADIWERSDQGIFLRDTVSGTCMLATSDPEIGKQWIQKHENRAPYDLWVVFSPEHVSFLQERYGLSGSMVCRQAVYLSSTPPTVNSRLTVQTATLQALDTVTAHYSMLNREELAALIVRGDLLLGYWGQELVGFIGQHSEGSMGLLEVFPAYRRMGFGSELEAYLIAYQLKRGNIPFCHVEGDNTASWQLQQKLGLTGAANPIYWVY